MSVDLSDLPIPPNCPYFSECDEGPSQKKSVHFEIRGGDNQVLVSNDMMSNDIVRNVPQIIRECLCHCDAKMVHIICVIAEDAWRREEFRLDNKIMTSKSGKDISGKALQAEENARKWAAAVSRKK